MPPTYGIPAEDETESAAPEIAIEIGPDAAGLRLDRALAAAARHPGLSRTRLGQLIAQGRVRDAAGAPIADPRQTAVLGARYRVAMPPPAPADPQPEAIPLAIQHEDADLLVVDKPPGLVVHPAPGAAQGTLVNALLHHCGEGLSGIGGERRPGIVHRIDKDTSGLLVVAKSQAAHEGLARQFAEHTVHRRYLAVTRGAPDGADRRLAGLSTVRRTAEGLTVDAPLARHPTDRTRMAVARQGGKRAVTHLRLIERYGPADRPLAALVACRLETGRTHQIRVHAQHIGHPLVGDPVYDRDRPWPKNLAPDLAAALGALRRQALHAAELGFEHPVTGATLRFESPAPPDLANLISQLRRNAM